MGSAFACVQAHGGIEVRSQRCATVTQWIPELAEGLRLAGTKVGEVRLIVGIDAGHQFDIGAVGVGQASVPRITELLISPGPLLLARSDVMVGHMDEAGVRGMVVAAEEITPCVHDHVTRGHGNIGVAAEIVRRVIFGFELGWRLVRRNAVGGTLRVVDPVVASAGQWEAADRPTRMVGDMVHVRRKE
jgi:hypothetical protein